MTDHRRAILGHQTVPFPSPRLAILADHGHLADEPQALERHLADAGYCRLTGFLPRPAVLAARHRIAEHLVARGDLCPVTAEGLHGRPVNLLGYRPLTHDPTVRRVLEAPELLALGRRLFAVSARPYDFKWLRTVPTNGRTAVHVDRVYMGRGSDRVLTCWIPLGDVPVEHGALALVPTSHRCDGYARARTTYGRIDVDRDRLAGRFDEEPLTVTDRFGGQWHSADFRAGDVVIFGLDLFHASTVNQREDLRLSCDVRIQPADEPVDPRWVGERPPGHRAVAPRQDMTTARAAWGL